MHNKKQLLYLSPLRKNKFLKTAFCLIQIHLSFLTKKPSIWSKKNAGVQSRADKDKQLTSEEEDTLAKSQ